MKKMILNIFAFAFLCGGIVACKKSEIKTYDGLSSIFFGLPFEISPAIDTSSINLAFIPDVESMNWKVTVRCMGLPQERDRPYRLKVSTASTAKEGLHYDAFETNRTMKAGRVADTILITAHKTDPELKTNRYSLILELENNENFDTKLKSVVDAATQKTTLNYIKETLYFTAKLGLPTNSTAWDVYYLGTYSEKKLWLLQEVNAIAYDQLYKFFLPTTTGIFNTTQRSAFGLKLRNYLQFERAYGRTVFEADGVTEMKAGNFFY